MSIIQYLLDAAAAWVSGVTHYNSNVGCRITISLNSGRRLPEKDFCSNLTRLYIDLWFIRLPSMDVVFKAAAYKHGD
jgi:uncharacterized protein Veg